MFSLGMGIFFCLRGSYFENILMGTAMGILGFYAVKGIYFAKIQKQTGKLWIFAAALNFLCGRISFVGFFVFYCGKHLYKSVLFGRHIYNESGSYSDSRCTEQGGKAMPYNIENIFICLAAPFLLAALGTNTGNRKNYIFIVLGFVCCIYPPI